MTGFYDAQVREQLARATAAVKFWRAATRSATEKLVGVAWESGQARRAWQSTIVEARRQHARAEQAEARIAAVRAAVRVADAEDVTDWQRGYRACSDRALAALDSPAAPEQPACCVCGGGPATYFNYLNLAFCPLCADCQCGQNPCERTGVNDPAVSSTAAAAEPCTGRTGFCRPCRTMHPRPS